MEFALNADDSKLQNAASALRDKLGDWSVAWSEVAEAIHAMVRVQFDSQGMGTWAPLSRRYAARKAKRYPGKPLLRATDRLFNSLTGESSDSLFQSSPGRLTVGTALSYAVYHQSAESRTTRLPRRPIFDFIQDVSRLAAVVQPLGGLAREIAQSTGFDMAGGAGSAAYDASPGGMASGESAAITGDVADLSRGI